jgi:hypothetical protein
MSSKGVPHEKDNIRNVLLKMALKCKPDSDRVSVFISDTDLIKEEGT